MNGKVNVQGYLDSVNAPWGKLFYRLVWHNLKVEGKKVLDFGSGFGITADHLAELNEVTAVEPNEEMLKYRFCAHEYEQLVGGMEQLKAMPNSSFDVIICHNVLEYLDHREELLGEFFRLLKPDGFVSILKHNKAGKIMQKAVFEYKIEEALDLLHDGTGVSVNFGVVNEYSNQELEQYCRGLFVIDQIYGVRTFFALQRNELKTGETWLEDMYRLECAAEEIPEFRAVAFFQHVVLKKMIVMEQEAG
ncbi:MAG: class I SAM-dependent methyltransferase [Lachnospiraceae bacterium]|nr:class I SAM-dependent methyltransferase [Lachnospiraceae bacterium]